MQSVVAIFLLLVLRLLLLATTAQLATAFQTTTKTTRATVHVEQQRKHHHHHHHSVFVTPSSTTTAPQRPPISATSSSNLSSVPPPAVLISRIRALKMTDGGNDGGNESTPQKEDNNNNDSSSTSSLKKKADGRKRRVIVGYRVSFITNLLVGIFTLAISRLSKGSVSLAQASYYASGPVMASILSQILVGAARNNRLQSDTYKRLNVLLSKYGMLWLVSGLLTKMTATTGASAAAASTSSSKVFTNPLVVVASLAAFVNGIKGFAYGVKGYDKQGSRGYGQEILDMIKSVPQVLFSPIKNLVGTGYLVTFGMVATMKLLKLLDIMKLVFGSGTGAATAALLPTRITRYAKLTMFAGILFCLKDASDRNRLSGATFIQLNLLSSTVFASLAAYVYQEAGNQLTKLAGALLFFSAFCFVNAMISIAVKNNNNNNNIVTK